MPMTGEIDRTVLVEYNKWQQRQGGKVMHSFQENVDAQKRLIEQNTPID